MKIMRYFLLLFFVFVSMPSCLYSSEKGSVEQFYHYLQTGELDKAYTLLSTKDQEHISINEFTGKNKSQKQLNKKYWSYVKYKILSMDKLTDKIDVKVELIAPNLGEILGKEIAGNLIRLNAENIGENSLNEEKRTELLLNRLEKGDFNYITLVETVHVLSENNQQKISLNIDRDREIFQLIQEAIAYGKDNKYDLAVKKLEKALTLDPENKIAKQYMEIMLNKKN